MAEGIETREQWQYFIDRDCKSMQGYYFLKPAPLNELYAYVDQGPKVAAPVKKGSA